MKKTNTKSKKGFTIIEVVLVLAIAGLIFLMVFIALPNLQRTQRDTQRRNDLDRLSTSLTQYITNNNQAPSGTSSAIIDISATTASSTSSWEKFAYNYLLASGSDTFVDPNGGSYGLMAYDCTDDSTCKTNAQLAPLSEPFNNRSDTGSSTAFNNAGVMVVMKGAKCGAEVENQAFDKVNGARRYAVAMRLESNGIYCVDNS